MLPVAILAGGLATRLRPVTEKIPKSLIEISGEPFLAHQLRLLASRGIRRVTIRFAARRKRFPAIRPSGLASRGRT